MLGSLQRSSKPEADGDEDGCSMPKNPAPAVGLSSLEIWALPLADNFGTISS